MLKFPECRARVRPTFRPRPAVVAARARVSVMVDRPAGYRARSDPPSGETLVAKRGGLL
jgi:hypothetical protein